jgi:hypothetical protein
MADETPNEQYKVGRVTVEYGLEELHDELAERWLGDGRDAQSLRELADELNVAVLEAAMDDAGLDPLEGEVRNAYRLLTDDDVSAGMRTQQRSQLEREGVDVDELTSDFVTHQAVYTYLTDALGVSKDREESATSVEKHDQRVNRLRSRTEAVTESSLNSLTSAGKIHHGDHDVVVDIQVFCHDCGSQYAVSTLLERGGCDCSS